MRIHFFSLPRTRAVSQKLISQYGQSPLESCDVIVVLGGDGVMLNSLHRYVNYGKPFYGLNYGTKGFLMNDPSEDLLESLSKAEVQIAYPLKVTLTDQHDHFITTHAFNEVTLFRKKYRALSWRLMDEQHTMEAVGDGCIVATPLGSSAYNASAGGHQLALNATEWVITLVNVLSPSGLKSWCVSQEGVITLDVLSPKERPAMVGMDTREYPHIQHVEIRKETTMGASLLFLKPR